jgi:hypothetical protein
MAESRGLVGTWGWLAELAHVGLIGRGLDQGHRSKQRAAGMLTRVREVGGARGQWRRVGLTGWLVGAGDGPIT